MTAWFLPVHAVPVTYGSLVSSPAEIAPSVQVSAVSGGSGSGQVTQIRADHPLRAETGEVLNLIPAVHRYDPHRHAGVDCLADQVRREEVQVGAGGQDQCVELGVQNPAQLGDRGGRGDLSAPEVGIDRIAGILGHLQPSGGRARQLDHHSVLQAAASSMILIISG